MMTTETKTNGALAFEPARLIDITKIDESDLNPRKTFDEAKLRELAATVKSHGILEDLTVRKTKGDRYEIVFGARRRRAALLAGLTEIPCKVREMTDDAALELMTIENLQRDDVHPLEEAEGYERLVKKYGRSVEDVATKVGKSVGYVYQRMKLLALSPKARKAFRCGELSAAVALFVARIPNTKLQDEAVLEVGAHGIRDEGCTARQALEYIRRNYMLSLQDAPFDAESETLVPDAGTCTKCPKRTGNQTLLFADVKQKDMCTDPPCFSQKTKASNVIRLKVLAEQGSTIADAKQRQSFYPYDTAHSPKSGYVDLDRECYDDPKSRTYRALTKGAKLQTIAVVGPDDRIHELVTESVMSKALKASGVKLRSSGSSAASGRGDAKWQKDEAERGRKMAIQREASAIALERIGIAATNKERSDRAFWLLLAQSFQQNAGFESIRGAAKSRAIVTKKGQTPDRGLSTWFTKASAAQLRGFVVELAASVGAFFGDAPASNLVDAGKLFHVDVKKIIGEVQASKKKKVAEREEKATRATKTRNPRANR